MDTKLRKLVLLLMLVAGLAPAGTITYQVEDLGGDLYRIQYGIELMDFGRNYELEILFAPAVYQSLAKPVAPAGLDILLFQPNDPTGAPGRLSALALGDYPALTGELSVEVRMLACCVPGTQEFAINQLDEAGVILRTIAEGHTTPTPEPSNLALIAVTLLVVYVAPVCRHRMKQSG